MFTTLNKQLVEFRTKQQIRRERWKAAVFAGYKDGEEIVHIGGVAVLRFSYRDHRFLKQITRDKIYIRVRPESEQHVVVTGNATQL